jgi:peptidoglycan/LPS O-acetylase OafA/YrhL
MSVLTSAGVKTSTRAPAAAHSATAAKAPSSQPASRIPELDGLRGIAVLMVLTYHLFNYSMAGRHWTGLGGFAFSATKDGWEGVDLFFALSGFLALRRNS